MTIYRSRGKILFYLFYSFGLICAVLVGLRLSFFEWPWLLVTVPFIAQAVLVLTYIVVVYRKTYDDFNK